VKRLIRQPLAADLLLVLVILAVGEAGASGTAARVFTIALVAPLLWRRRTPFAVFCAIAALAFAHWVADISLSADLALLVAIYTVAAQEPRGRLIAACAMLELGVVLAVARWWAEAPVSGFVLLTGMATAAVVLGLNVRTRRSYTAALEERAAQLERERDQQGRLAVAAERARIAREMHDIVAHNLSVMIALADGATFMAQRDPAQSTGAMENVSRTGRHALGEMRRLVGVLRDDDAAALAPQPGLSDLDSLLEQVRAAGLRATLDTSGPPIALGAGAELAVYRLVAEGACRRAAVLRRGRRRGRGHGRRRRAAARFRRRARARWDARARRRLRRGARGRPCARRRLARARTARERGVIAVLLADDQPLLRMGFRMILEAQPDMRVAGEAADGEEAVERTAALAPDVVLMDVRMPGIDGIEATRRIIGSGSAARVLILTTFDLDEYAFSGLRAGASGFLLKDAPPDQLLGGIRAVARGDAVVAPTVTRRLLDAYAHQFPDEHAPATRSARHDPLTEREREVLLAVAGGLSNAEIAERLVVAEATVKTHVGRILSKLGLRDRVQAVIFAYETGLVRASER
jgi:DNA-binding NarL/FixJ family response regulator/signal transduction histidine kinase